MDPEVQQRIVDCLEACRYFANPAALPEVIEALNDVLAGIRKGQHLTMNSPEVVELIAAMDCLSIKPPADPEAN